MRWELGRRSTNVEDRRGIDGARGPRIALGPATGIGGVGAVVAIVLALFFGVDPSIFLDPDSLGEKTQGPVSASRGERSASEGHAADMASSILADTEDTWQAIMAQEGRRYEPPILVLFSGVVDSACGVAQSATGPFYCPGDRKVYLDLEFFEELAHRFEAQGDFARAYVIAHEVGHHVQNTLEITDQVRRFQQESDRASANQASVLLELQADCLAGVWAFHSKHDRDRLEPGDIDEAMTAAAAVGDDRLQRSAGRRVSPESFTHGSSADRQRWFSTGFKAGKLDACDTFDGARS